MPSIVLKATPDRDLYCYWSSVVEAPVFIGTRAEISAHLVQGSANPEVEARMARADRVGTSALYFDTDPQDGAWESTGFIYQQQGFLPRSRLAALLDMLAVDERADATDLLDPFED